MNKQELISKLKYLRDVEIWAARNFKREDFKNDSDFMKSLEKHRKEAQYYSTVMQFAEQLDESPVKECDICKFVGIPEEDGGCQFFCCLENYKSNAGGDRLTVNFCPNCGAKIKRGGSNA